MRWQRSWGSSGHLQEDAEAGLRGWLGSNLCFGMGKCLRTHVQRGSWRWQAVLAEGLSTRHPTGRDCQVRSAPRALSAWKWGEKAGKTLKNKSLSWR